MEVASGHFGSRQNHQLLFLVLFHSSIHLRFWEQVQQCDQLLSLGSIPHVTKGVMSLAGPVHYP